MRAFRVLSLSALMAVALTGVVSASPARAQPAPLIVVMMENHGYYGAVGNTNMPFFNQLWNEGKAGTGPVTDYQQMYAVSHPSLPNYLAIVSGSIQGQAGNDSAQAGEFNAPSVWDQLTAAGVSWGVYEEAMPAVCSNKVTYNDTATGGTDGEYVLRHNPGAVFAPVYTSAECQQVQPLSALNLAALPQVSFVTPNLCDDDHGIGSGYSDPFQNCVTDSAALLQRGDAWLQQHVSAWTSAGANVLITWDEGSGTAGVNGSTTGGGRVAVLLTGPNIPPGQDSTQYSHYSVLAGIENLYGMPLLAGAATANPIPLPGGTISSPPVVTITQPASNSTVSGTVTVSGTAQAQGGATIAQVQVSVDNGAPQLATGTTNWAASVDTTALANGPHTITVRATDTNGNTGSASVPVTVSNASTTSCPTTPPGTTELSGNVSLETSQTGWTGVYNSSSVVTRAEPAGGSYDGLWALQVAPKPGASGAAGLNNASPIWVPGPPGTATTAGQVYTGSAFVQASTAGEQITLVVREVTTGGTVVGHHSTTLTPGDNGWHQISSAYTASGTGNVLRYTLYASNFASSSQYFLADCLSLQTP
jgi:phosphatidylinositol-3-phosphatase